jgi:branched-chain amino acid transport system permease protein
MNGETAFRVWLDRLQMGAANIARSLWRRWRRRPVVTIAQVGLLVAALTYPLIYVDVVVPLQRVVPLPFPDLSVATFMVIFAMLALGLNIVVGFAGLLDLGYVAFYAIGAYVAAFLASPHWWGVSVVLFSDAPNGAPGIHLNFVIIVVVAALVTGVAGAVLGAPALRVRGDYLAIVTLAFGEIVPVAFRNLNSVTISLGPIQIVRANITGGPLGINPIDPPNLFGVQFGATSGGNAYWLGIAIILAVVVFARNVRNSRLGRAWMAVREDEIAAQMMGIDIFRTKLLAFAMGAAIGGVGGAFQASYLGATSSDYFAFMTSILILCMVILGGMGNLLGVLLGGAVLEWINLTVLGWVGDRINDIGRATNTPLLTEIVPSRYNFLLFGLLLVIMMNIRPEGLMPSRQRQAELHMRARAEEPAQEQP